MPWLLFISLLFSISCSQIQKKGVNDRFPASPLDSDLSLIPEDGVYTSRRHPFSRLVIMRTPSAPQAVFGFADFHGSVLQSQRFRSCRYRIIGQLFAAPGEDDPDAVILTFHKKEAYYRGPATTVSQDTRCLVDINRLNSSIRLPNSTNVITFNVNDIEKEVKEPKE